MNYSKWKNVIGIVIVIFVLVCSFACDKRAIVKPTVLGPKDAVAAISEAKEVKKAISPYEMEIKPLTTVECARCHNSIFEVLKKTGGKHRIDCVRCHTKYHAYNPRKQNYDEIMPKCSSCHVSKSGGPFHGDNKKLIPCLNCHVDPHKPLAIPMSNIDTSCTLCHAKEAVEIQKYPSKHSTEVSCADCHAEKHGNIPECSVCHETHSPEVEMTSKDCMSCHPVHKPKLIYYPKTTASKICAGCHEKDYEILVASKTKHAKVPCADCHPKHKEIPSCRRCHPNTHTRGKMADVSKCADCHGKAHNVIP